MITPKTPSHASSPGCLVSDFPIFLFPTPWPTSHFLLLINPYVYCFHFRPLLFPHKVDDSAVSMICKRGTILTWSMTKGSILPTCAPSQMCHFHFYNGLLQSSLNYYDLMILKESNSLIGGAGCMVTYTVDRLFMPNYYTGSCFVKSVWFSTIDSVALVSCQCCDSPFGACHNFYTISFPTTLTSNTTWSSISYVSRSRAACTVIWAFCKAICFS